MEVAQIQQFLALLGETYAKEERGWVKTHCPLAPWTHQSGKDSHPSFGIKIDPVRSFYNCWACGGGSLDDLLTQIRWHTRTSGIDYMNLSAAYALLDDEALVGAIPSADWSLIKANQLKHFEAWPEWWLETFVPVTKVEVGISYVRNRQVPDSVIKLLDLRYDTMRHTVCFPVRDFNGTLAGMRGRYVVPLVNEEGKEKRYHDYDWQGSNNTWKVFLNENHLNFSEPVVLVEGPFDLASVVRVWENTISPMSVGFSESKMDFLLQAGNVVCMFDFNKAGQTAANKVQRHLWGQVNVDVVEYPNGWEKDPGQMSVSEIQKILEPFI